MDWRFLIHPGAHGCHDVPVVEIDQEALDIGPLAAHLGFYRMNRAYVIPEHAMAVILLSQNGSASRKAAELFDKPMRIHADIGRDSLDILVGDKGAAITDAAFSALLAGKSRSTAILFGIFIRGHGVSPWPVAGLPDPHI